MSRDVFHVSPQYQPLMRVVGLDAETVFTHPQIVVWRKLSDRENCTLDAEMAGKRLRLHVKRYTAAAAGDAEVKGIQLLQSAEIPTVPLVGWGTSGGRSFVISEDLAGYKPADKALDGGLPFASLLEPTADLAAKLHRSGLHHRDLYLCHFFLRPDNPSDVRLIDAARVARLPRWFAKRWIVKDLAQFLYSLQPTSRTYDEQARWTERYREKSGIDIAAIRVAIERKVNAIYLHDQKLNRNQPRRNISIPEK